MEVFEINADNIKRYLDDCIALQEHLVKPDSVIDAEKFISTAMDGHTYFLGILNSEKVVGMGVVSKITHPVDITGYVNNIVVHPDTRGMGLFKVIMDALEAKAKEWGCADLALTCSRENVKDLYVKRGYKKKETDFYILKIS